MEKYFGSAQTRTLVFTGENRSLLVLRCLNTSLGYDGTSFSVMGDFWQLLEINKSPCLSKAIVENAALPYGCSM